MNTPTTIKACVSFFRPVRAHPKLQATAGSAISKSQELLSGGGPENNENPKNPFLLFSALVDLGVDCQSYAGTMHGGLYGVLMDEVMGTAANFQSGKFFPPSIRPPFIFLYLSSSSPYSLLLSCTEPNV